jgi:hypothetical protein
MANCKISKPVTQDCKTNVSGILKMAFANWDDGYTASSSVNTCIIDTIDLGTENFYAIEIATDSGTASAELSAGANKDAKAINHIVAGTWNTLDCDIIGEYKNFLLGKIIVAFLTRNREVYIAGFQNGLTSDTFNFSTGAAEGDQAGITFSYSGIQPEFFLKVIDWGLIESLM